MNKAQQRFVALSVLTLSLVIVQKIVELKEDIARKKRAEESQKNYAKCMADLDQVQKILDIQLEKARFWEQVLFDE